jgi:glycosyltransferase involved in cell wall biosynthesis
MSEHLIERSAEEDNESSVRRIRVLLLIKGLGRGGAEQLVVNAVEYGDGARFEYQVAYLLPWKDAFVADLHALGVMTTCLDGAKGVAWLVRLRRLIRDQGIDVVHVHSPYAASFARCSLPRSLPMVTTEHNVWPRYHRATYWANATTFPRNDHVFAVSDEVRDSIRYPKPLRFLHTPPLETLHHGIDFERVTATPAPTGLREELGIAADAPVVGTVANFKPHKGHEYLVRTAALVSRVRPDVRFVFVGAGPQQDEIRSEAARLGVGGAVIFAGFREDALRVARIFDLYAMSSVHEGLPLALLESMAIGCPPVATRVGGINAIIEDGESGYIVEPRDPEAQADRILALLADASLRSRMGSAARDKAAAFDVRATFRRIEHVYSELLR